MNIPISTINTCIRKQKTLGLIGDLDGNYENLWTHLLALHLIDKDTGSWIGNDTHVIFSGDILADRYAEGFDILVFISRLRTDAERAGGSIQILAGNHERKMFSFLGKKYTNSLIDEVIQENGSQYYGMIELMAYLGSKENSQNNATEIISNMQADRKGRILLYEMCATSLIILEGNTIHSHTPPSRRMLDTLSTYYELNNNDWKQTIDAINSIWKLLLQRMFLVQNPKLREIPHEEKGYFDRLCNIFLHTLNGTEADIHRRTDNFEGYTANIVPYEHPAYTKLQGDGIESWYHGHTDDSPEILEMSFSSVNRKSQRIRVYMPPPGGNIQKQTKQRVAFTLKREYSPLSTSDIHSRTHL